MKCLHWEWGLYFGLRSSGAPKDMKNNKEGTSGISFGVPIVASKLSSSICTLQGGTSEVTKVNPHVRREDSRREYEQHMRIYFCNFTSAPRECI